jgi:hypothetical protein
VNTQQIVVPAKAGTQFCLLLCALAFASSVFACGYCVEDKIAAVYDHAALTQARAKKQTVVYFAIDGAIRDAAPFLKTIIEQTQGVEKGSARVSVEAQALAVTFDPRRVALPTLQSAVEKALRPRGLGLLLLDTK